MLYTWSPIQIFTLNCKDTTPITVSVEASIYQGIGKLTDGSQETAVESKLAARS